MRLPGVCKACREPVVWNGKMWRKPGRGTRHVCRSEPATSIDVLFEEMAANDPEFRGWFADEERAARAVGRVA